MLIDRDDLPVVAMEFMNDVHYEDMEIINKLFELVLAYGKEPTLENQKALDQKYQEWIAHTVDHFKGEEVMMLEKGFPPYAMHKGEHDRALEEMQTLFRQWQESRDISPLKIYLIERLPQWLVHHISTMDTVTANFFKTGLSPCGVNH